MRRMGRNLERVFKGKESVLGDVLDSQGFSEGVKCMEVGFLRRVQGTLRQPLTVAGTQGKEGPVQGAEGLTIRGKIL